MPVFKYNGTSALTLDERITTPSIHMQKDGDHWYVPLFEGEKGSVVQYNGYKYTLGDFMVTYRDAIDREKAITADRVFCYAGKIDKYEPNEGISWVLTPNGDLYGCGSNMYCQQGTEVSHESYEAFNETTIFPTFTKRAENVKDFSCSKWTTWYIDNNDILYGCGNNQYGQQGTGDVGDEEDFFEDVSTFTKRGEYAIKVKCTAETTWYLNEAGKLYGCGWNQYGQQGISYTDGKFIPVFIQRYERVKDFFCSSRTTWILTLDNILLGSGDNSAGQQGANTSAPYVGGFQKRAEKVKTASCSNLTTWYIIDFPYNDLYGCGLNNYGQQGSENSSRIPTFVRRATNVKDVKCSDSTTWYLTYKNELYGCGLNDRGQQGSGDTENVKLFTKRAENVKDFMCLNGSTWYLDYNNDLYACGENIYGQLGFENTENVLTFTKIAENVKEIGCSDATSWYITYNNELYGCGWNGDGNLGNGEFVGAEDWQSKDDLIVPTFTKRII